MPALTNMLRGTGNRKCVQLWRQLNQLIHLRRCCPRPVIRSDEESTQMPSRRLDLVTKLLVNHLAGIEWCRWIDFLFSSSTASIWRSMGQLIRRRLLHLPSLWRQTSLQLVNVCKQGFHGSGVDWRDEFRANPVTGDENWRKNWNIWLLIDADR